MDGSKRRLEIYNPGKKVKEEIQDPSVKRERTREEIVIIRIKKKDRKDKENKIDIQKTSINNRWIIKELRTVIHE